MRRQKTIALTLVVMVLLFSASPVLAVEAGSGPLDKLGINLGFLIAQLVNFGLIFGLLTFALWQPLTNMLDRRSAEIEKGLDDAEAAANARRNAEAEAEKILAQARSEAAQVVEESRGRGEEVEKTIEEEAREEAEKIREDARLSAQAERNTQLAGLRDQVAAISMAVAERLIGETLDESRQQELISNFLTDLPEGAKSLSGNVVVTSAMPLDDDEQARVREALGTDDVTFNVDPSILGGLIVRSGDRVMDGSVRKGMSDISGRLR